MISVIIPALDAAGTIGECLAALARQTVPADEFEVIVVDSSADRTGELASGFNVRVLPLPHSGPAAARNHGVAAARGEIILFTDADCTPAPDWIERMVAPILSGDADGVKGAYLTRQPELLPRFMQAEFEERYRRQARAGRIDFVDTYSAAYRREVFARAGGFDETFKGAEDAEFSYRLAEQGHRLVFAPAARVYHRHADRLGSYLIRRFFNGIWRGLVYRRFPDKAMSDSYTPKAMMAQIGLVGLLLAALVAGLVAPVALTLAGALVLLFLATTVPFTIRTARRDPAVAVVGPLLIFLRSAAIGGGLAVGLVLTLLSAITGREPTVPDALRGHRRIPEPAAEGVPQRGPAEH